MPNTHGAVETAKRLLASREAASGFTALWERGRLDLTIEALVVKDQFASLFTDDEGTVNTTALSQGVSL